MSKNTVNPALMRRKRSKRVVENPEYACFARRVLKAYARRIADGDIAALRELVVFVTDVDDATRVAVAGLRRWGYSWFDIATQVGMSKQAARQRWGTPAERHALDRRLLEAGLGVSVATLVQIFADHYPGTPQPALCPACGYRYPDQVTDCPTNATVRQQLYKRRAEDPAALRRLTRAQYVNLHDRKTARTNRVALSRASHPIPDSSVDAGVLFTLSGGAP
jgi:hypothetical protein